MEKYKVVKADVKNAFYQTLELKGNNIWAYDRLKSIQVDRTNPKFKKGDNFKIYRDKYGIEVAYSYKLQGERFVDLHAMPESRFGIDTFFNDMCWGDRVRLGADIRRALKRFKIKPTMSRINNLSLLVAQYNRGQGK